jgi:hypothetical protein
MPKLVIANSAQLRLLWGLNTNVNAAINVLGVSKPAGVTITQALANTIGAAVKSAVGTSLLAAELHTATTLNRCGLRSLDAANEVEFFDTGAPVAGTATGDVLPRAVALVATLRTAKAGHSFRGRVYIGGFSELANQTGANAAPSTATAVGAFITAIQNALKANGLDLAVLARPAEARVETITVTHADGTTSSKTKSHPARTGQVTIVTAVEVRNQSWDSQRRRTSIGSTSTLLLAPSYQQSS